MLHTKISVSSITYSNVTLHEISLHVMSIAYILNINTILQNKGIKIYRKMHDSRMSVCVRGRRRSLRHSKHWKCVHQNRYRIKSLMA